MTDVDIDAMLRARYCLPEWALFSEVTIGGRRADFVAVNLYESRRAIVGVEVKVTRSDWVRELKEPSKAEEMWKVCDAIYLAVPDIKIVQDDLPLGWGLLIPRGGRLYSKVRPRKNVARRDSPRFLVRMIAKAMFEREGEIARRVQEQREEMRESLESEEVKSLRTQLDRTTRTIESLSETIDRGNDELLRLSAATAWLEGMYPWQKEQALKAVEWLRDQRWLLNGHKRPTEHALSKIEDARKQVESADRALAALLEFLTAKPPATEETSSAT